VNDYESSEAAEDEYIEADSIGSNCDSVQECVSISSNESQESEYSNDSENCMLGNRQKNIRVKNRRINNHADSNASKRTTRSSNLTMSTNNISVNKYESSVSDSESNLSHSAKVSNHNEERRSTRIQSSVKNYHKQHEDYNQPIKSNFRSERKRKRSQRYLTQENSQFASNSEESNSDSDFMEKKTSTKSTRSTRKLAKLSSDSEDMWDQENEIEGSSDSSDESCQIVKQQRKSVSNQNMLTNRTSKRVKRQQSCNTKMDKQIKHRHSPLPKIPRLTKGKVEYGNIEKKSLLILKHLKHLDSENLFKTPVIEQIPQIKKEYLSVIDKPMDFRSIEDHRLSSYNEISELQDDLILIFKNCCMYNEVGSSYWEYSKNMWENLPSIFEKAFKNRKRR